MKLEAMVSQNIFTKGIRELFSNNPGRSYTVKELMEDKRLINSVPQVKKSVELLVKQGLLKIKRRGSEICYQFVPAQKK